jgi:hypothetical protein
MVCVADSRFQTELLRQAKDAGKIEKGFEIPAACRDNSPERIERALAQAQADGVLEPFPFGTDFTQTEQRLVPALKRLASASPGRLAGLLLRGLGARADQAGIECLDRMGLARPKGFSEWAYAALVRGALRNRKS